LSELRWFWSTPVFVGDRPSWRNDQWPGGDTYGSQGALCGKLGELPHHLDLIPSFFYFDAHVIAFA